MSYKDLSRLRKAIDRIDTEVLKLLNERMRIVQDVGKLKQKMGEMVYHPDREQAILQRLKSINQGPLKEQVIDAIFREIFSASRNLQEPERIAYLGPDGSFSHEAAQNRFGTMAKYLAANSIKSVFKAVESGHTGYAVVPIENKIAGILGETINLLEISRLRIVDETSLPILLVFATRCEKIGQVRVIYSKDIAFQQCKNFLAEQKLRDVRLIPVQSTSEGARLAANEKQSAAICSEMAAELNRLPILHHDIEDVLSNRTRFVILSNVESKPSGMDKTSILADFSAGDRSFGDLMYSLTAGGISLIRVDSCPTEKSDGFTYRFFIEFSGHYDDQNVKTVLDEYKGMIKCFGSYLRRI